MWISKIKLIRYLVVLRVNTTLVRFFNPPSVEFSFVLGHAIAERLPAAPARKWRKSLSGWEKCGIPAMKDKEKYTVLPESPWPVETIITPYPGKRYYGEGEMISWELAILGDDADHRFFLETILPAIEETGMKQDSRWRYRNCLWGHFDIHSVFAAKGVSWEPIVSDGQLDLKRKVDANQWRHNLPIEFYRKKSRHHLNWVTPFRLTAAHSRSAPSLYRILCGFINRMDELSKKVFHLPDDFTIFFDNNNDDAESLADIFEISKKIPVVKTKENTDHHHFPKFGCGEQTFSSSLPICLHPLLTMAGIIHIGQKTHYGCGCFVIR